MWTHAILEIYEPDTGWPKDGTPAEWIESRRVGWCDGELGDLISATPSVALVKFKVSYWIERTKWRLFWRWLDSDERLSIRLFLLWLIRKYDPVKEMDEWFEEISEKSKTMTERQQEEMNKNVERWVQEGKYGLKGDSSSRPIND